MSGAQGKDPFEMEMRDNATITLSVPNQVHEEGLRERGG